MWLFARLSWATHERWLTGTHAGLGYTVPVALRTFSLGCRNRMAGGFALDMWVTTGLWLPGSHLFIGLHEKTGCVRTNLMGSCSIMALPQFLFGLQGSAGCVRTLFLGCTRLMAAVRTAFTGSCASMAGGSQHFYGLQTILGCRVRTIFLGCS